MAAILERPSWPVTSFTLKGPLYYWQVFLFQIDMTLTVAVVTENGRQYRLK